MAIKNAFYAQSGGVTAVINASACGVIQTARKHPDQIGKVYAGRNGIIGALREELIDTGAETAAAIKAISPATPAPAFGTPHLTCCSHDLRLAQRRLQRVSATPRSTCCGHHGRRTLRAQPAGQSGHAPTTTARPSRRQAAI